LKVKSIRAELVGAAQPPPRRFQEAPPITKDQKIIRDKAGLLELAKQLGDVSQACKVMGYSWASFYRFRDLCDKGGELALREADPEEPRNRVAPEIEEAACRGDRPARLGPDASPQ
jgi:hypothetical protein